MRFREFEEKWEKARLSEHLEFKNGLNTDSKNFGKGVKFISVMDILNNQYITYDNIIGLVDIDIETQKRYEVNYGDILFQRSSETFEDIGQANVYLDNKSAVFGGFVIRGKKIGNYYPKFFKYLLNGPTARKKVIIKGAGAQHYNIGQEGLSSVSLHFPAIQEQEKIANLLSLLDDRISTQSQTIGDFKTLQISLINYYYHFQRYNDIALADCIVQKSERNKKNEDYPVLSVSNKYGFIRQSEQFENREVASEDTSNYKIVRENDFAYNPARINVGSIAKLKNYDNGIVSPMYVCFRTKDNLLPDFLEFYFNSQSFKNEMNKRLEGSVRQCLTFESLCDIPICLPTIEEQKNTASRLISIQKKIDIESDIKQLFEKQKKYLLQQLFI